MNTITFDTHSFVKRLESKGMPEAQAEEVIDIVRETRQESLNEAATKADLQNLEIRLENKIQNLELRLTVRLGSMIFALGGVLIAVKYFGH